MTGNASTPFKGESRLQFNGTDLIFGHEDVNLQLHPSSFATKIRFWGSSTQYTMGMQSSQTYGYLNDYAIVNVVNQDTDRGWVWRGHSHSASQGAMSLTTDGRLYIDQIVNSPRYDFHDGGYITSDGSTMRFQF